MYKYNMECDDPIKNLGIKKVQSETNLNVDTLEKWIK